MAPDLQQAALLLCAQADALIGLQEPCLQGHTL